MHKQVVERAAAVGLDYNFDIAKVTNTLKAHSLIHLAKKFHKANELKELFLKSYFTEGKDLNQNEVLVDLANQVGIPSIETEMTLNNNEYLNEVNHDIELAQQIGISGVPFFVIDRKYAISGAQPVSTFVNTIQEILSK